MVTQNSGSALEGAAPDVQVEPSSAAGTGSRIVEMKAMGVGTHVEYTMGTNERKDNEKEESRYTNNEGLTSAS